MYEYELKRSKRKTLSLEITRDCKVLVRAPLRLGRKYIDDFVAKHSSWIEEKLEKAKRKSETTDNLSEEEIKELKARAKKLIPERVELYAEKMGVKPKSIKITSAKARFGSCSTDNALCFSYRLMLYPQEAIDYVVVHELAHITHHNHSREFYSLIEQYMPDYKERVKLLKNE
ncbi:MAG: M48 family metallopeptidase [Clostridiales bacterium]|nr:M48 family metallopeptidase [Clostridiales bacterium]